MTTPKIIFIFSMAMALLLTSGCTADPTREVTAVAQSSAAGEPTAEPAGVAANAAGTENEQSPEDLAAETGEFCREVDAFVDWATAPRIDVDENPGEALAQAELGIWTSEGAIEALPADSPAGMKRYFETTRALSIGMQQALNGDFFQIFGHGIMSSVAMEGVDHAAVVEYVEATCSEIPDVAGALVQFEPVDFSELTADEVASLRSEADRWLVDPTAPLDGVAGELMFGAAGAMDVLVDAVGIDDAPGMDDVGGAFAADEVFEGDFESEEEFEAFVAAQEAAQQAMDEALGVDDAIGEMLEGETEGTFVTSLPPEGFTIQSATIGDVEVTVLGIDWIREHSAGSNEADDVMYLTINVEFDRSHSLNASDFEMVAPDGSYYFAFADRVLPLDRADITIPVAGTVDDLAGWKLEIASGDQSATINY